MRGMNGRIIEEGLSVQGRDIIVIGASAGGVEALSVIAAGLPADFPASVFVVLHTSPQSPDILDASFGGRRS
jgi:chemotaxis response regulator CheB